MPPLPLPAPSLPSSMFWGPPQLSLSPLAPKPQGLRKRKTQKEKRLQERRWGSGCESEPISPQQKGKALFTVGPRWNWFVQSHLIPECDICPHHKTTGYNVSDIIPSDITPPNDIIINPKWGSHHWAAFSKCSWNSFYRTRDLCAKCRRSHEPEESAQAYTHEPNSAFVLGWEFFFLLY